MKLGQLAKQVLKFSVRDGFANSISPDIIKHPANCRLVRHRENQIKNFKSHISIKQLLEKITEFNHKYNYAVVPER